MLESVLIANRGEIACRVIRTARRLGLRTVAVYSEADRGALHTCLADVAVPIGPAAARESYLDVDRILAAAQETGAQSIHPGYGFLSENAAFARACREAGVVFVGPPEEAILRMGSKSEARRLMASARVPVLPGYDGDDQAQEKLESEAKRLGFPLLIKPTAGGGGKGMRVVRTAADFAEALAGARREASKSFGDDRVLLERFVEKGRHVEIQVFADSHGSAVHLFERDCSLQRRHQKVIEEAPAPGLDERTRSAMGAAAVAAARAVGYQGAGTVEFLYDGREFYFLEMNTRLQVEHPVTEMITGIDLVEWQLRVASGEPLPLEQQAIRRNGHAVEARLYAEDPERGFLPSTGRLRRLRFAEGREHVRVDSGVREGDEVTVHYDPMLAKVIAWAPDRSGALDRLRTALEVTEVEGVRTNARFLWEILGAVAVREGDVSTRLLEQALQPVGETAAERTDAWLIAAAALMDPAVSADRAVPNASSPWAAGGGFRLNDSATIRLPLALGDERHWMRVTRTNGVSTIGLAGHLHEVTLAQDAGGGLAGTIDGRLVAARVEFGPETTVVRRQCLRFEFVADTGAEHHASAEHEGHLRAPMPGHVLDVRAIEGAEVAAGAVLVVLEAMKMEHSLAAPWAGTIKSVSVKPGDRVEEGAGLVLLEPLEESTLRQPVAQD
ncbi:MAG: acetyl/propionyl/methylcrotonyl-CoA carboxylase subunit alpha [Gammaproteobacteria bacterium]|nr:acetyl/propionyl/methylcrotonyl-CoA carboxylase subunit alpha [Gammaproteobacteria bacterium]